LLADETASHDNTIADREELTRRKALLSEALTTLNERERHIIVACRLGNNPLSCEELSRKYGILHQRVHQIEVRVLEKLRRMLPFLGWNLSVFDGTRALEQVGA
jgi:RNA polymerase sigma-32 factor